MVKSYEELLNESKIFILNQQKCKELFEKT